ncbi:hypothetical protein SAMN04488574_102196 [Bacillus sp. 71mf]|uniref:NUMOD3 domain-containing DNA-binding protein n=2 Tax=unclassified Bacillus (in: firmicutes) TaxID=185979 RepID=UPI0008F38744|nr:NUMOD3 domain-containing DNA-binding protein [Bacillus sp. 103mf]SFI27606.1 hypothetical protein SAMN04488574_102196 [Bacillus sp. 71mf]SFS39869.1 hypothetical protein SAMN04488145_101270 [Bacillus sp. 103mf]
MNNGDRIVWEFRNNYDPNKKYSFKMTRVHSKETREKISLSNKGKYSKNRQYVILDDNNNEKIKFNDVEELKSYMYSCWMGMISGVIIVKEA